MKNKIILRHMLNLIMAMSISTAAAQNLLDTSTWTPGSKTVKGFYNYGSLNENSREFHTGPQGGRYKPLVWKATPIVGNYANGGWTTTSRKINHKETYRFTVWMKKTGSNGGASFFGCRSDKILTLKGVETNNALFWGGDLPQLDKWYLIVGYVHSSKYNSNENYGGIYDSETGEKVKSITDFKFSSEATWAIHRNFLVQTPNANDRQYYYAPRLEQVNGEEPAVEELIGLNDTDCNIVDDSTWTIGSGTATGFTNYGSTNENKREYGKNHVGEDVILWTASPDEQLGSDGGWNTVNYTINNTETHRFSVWIKKTNSNDGTTYFGPRGVGNILELDGVLNDNPYFWAGDLPKLNRWYLLVGYVHPHTYNSTKNSGKIYDGVTGKVVRSITDFKFKSRATNVSHRAYLNRDGNTEDRQYFYAPRIDELSGCEPTINELLKTNEESSLIFSFDLAGNQTQRFYCNDTEYCSPKAPRKQETDEFTMEEALGLEPLEEEITEVTFKIFPNPTSGIATLQFEDEVIPEIEFIKLYTINSVLIKDIELNTFKNQFDIDLNDQPSGLYFVHVHLKDGSSITKKIIKK